MNFYERQAAARRQSRWLVGAFIVAIAIVVGVLTVVVLLLGLGNDGRAAGELLSEEPLLVLSVALFWLLVIMGASVYRSLALREGGGSVARTLGGTRVDRSTTDPDLRRLRNVVEEMAIASGVPVPDLYVLDTEYGINAFAAGHSPANAAVAVTRGTLMTLTREELQGVIAHEFSHILNGDMRLNIRMIGWLFGLMVIALMGRTLLRLAPNGRKGAAGVAVLGIALFVLGSLGRILGRLIQASVSRQRERLADASAVQFTRNPAGLKGALLKVAARPGGGRLGTARADEVAHMLFAPGLRGWFATHPPLEERVAALDPGIRPERFATVAAEYLKSWERLEAARVAAPAGETGAGSQDAARRLGSLLLPANAIDVAAQVGNPDTVQIALAHELRLALPSGYDACAESPPQARALLLATLISRDPVHRRVQRAAIESAVGPLAAAAAEAATPVADALPPLLRLPAVCGLFPALRRLAREERIQLMGLVAKLAEVDGDVDVFEFCLQRAVYDALVDELEARGSHGSGSLATSFNPLGVLFSVLALRGVSGTAGHAVTVEGAAGARGAPPPDAAGLAAAQRAYDAGIGHVLPGPRRPELDVSSGWPRRLWTALTRLQALQPQAKRQLVEAVVLTISQDEQLTVAEAELLRTVCAVLQCPLPPLLPRAIGPGAIAAAGFRADPGSDAA